MKTIIHVSQAVIRRNLKKGENEPPVIVRTYKSLYHANEVEIQGPSVVRHSPNKPLSCGARVWIETESPVIVLN